MAIQKYEFLKALSKRLESTADARRAYADPIEMGDRVVVPVAQIAYGLGGGYGRVRHEEEGDVLPEGGGGGIQVSPIGVLEITRKRTRFVALRPTRGRWVAVFGAGLALGHWLGRRGG